MQDVQNNGTFYLYAYVVRSGKPLDRKDPAFDPDSVAVKQHRTYPEHASLQLSSSAASPPADNKALIHSCTLYASK